MDTPINFELAKLLKEKGFNIPTREFWYKKKSNSKEYCTTGIEYDSDRDCIWDWNNNSGNGIASPYPNREYKYQYSAPTIAEVVMWLYEKHGVWISVIDKNTDQTEWEFQTSKKGIGLVFSSGQYPLKFYNSPTEAYEAAIEYCLTNLIK